MIYFAPIVILSIIVEYSAVKTRISASYTWQDTFTNLSLGIGSVMLGFFLRSIIYFPYEFFYQFRLFDLPKNPAVYVILIFAEDYCYYWFHRTSHVVRLLWCAHETHHSSEKLNISTAVRQPWTGFFMTWIFWVPLVIVGFPPEWVLLQQTLNLYYQLFTHTEAIRSLGPLEYVLNTPSHHRAHHAKNPCYLDKNFAGTFIIWDRLHHTFVKEDEPCVYGAYGASRSVNPVIVACHMWIKLFNDVVHARGWLNKIKTCIYPPGWNYDGNGVTTKELIALFASSQSHNHAVKQQGDIRNLNSD